MADSTPTARAAASIRGILRARGLTGAELADRLGIGESAASRRLNGVIAFSLDEIETVAAWLDLDPAVLATAIYGTPRTTART